MCNEKKDEKQETKEKSLRDKHEELRRWFESIGDCV
jgi:hypothetical protein